MSRLRTTLEMIRFSHTLFALPFALLAAVLAARGVPSWPTLVKILLAMVGARSAAMAHNRLTDRAIDAANPRTSARALPSGALTVGFVRVFLAASVALFLIAAASLNRATLLLSPVALALLFFYAYTKRFTWLSHLVLGLCLALAPVGAWIAVTGSVAWPPILLGLAVLLWTAGFDILYALQDEAFDRAEHLHSVPVLFGRRGALTIARALHVLTIVSLAAVGAAVPVGWLYALGVFVAAALLLYEHSLVRGDDLSRLDAAFFTMNGVISLTFFGFVLAERLVR